MKYVFSFAKFLNGLQRNGFMRCAIVSIKLNWPIECDMHEVIFKKGKAIGSIKGTRCITTKDCCMEVDDNDIIRN